ncbi:uncharacterized protein [Dysidea avara]|uniref:uncharacterized protein n=1 Tax=Dysidea avara TaxID=196820 RepID=UPI00332269BE
MMLGQALLLAVGLFGTISQAQPECEEDCDVCETTNTAFMNWRSCYKAAINVTARTHTPEQFEMACTSGGQQCYYLWYDRMRACLPDSFDAGIPSQTCALISPCYDLLSNTLGFDYVYNTYVEGVYDQCLESYLTNGTCVPSCENLLINATQEMQCCWPEFVSILHTYDNALRLESSQITWIISSLPSLCGLNITFCNDHPLPEPTACDDDFTELFVTNRTTCGAAVELLQESQYMDGYTEIFAIDGCPELYGRFTRSCHVLSQEKLESFLAVGNIISDLGQVEQCRPFVSELVANSMFNDETHSCIKDGFLRRCGDRCRQRLDASITRYGCCLADYSRTFYGKSEKQRHLFTYALEETIYDLCNRDFPGYCREDNVSISEDTRQCLEAGNSFFSSADEICLENYRELYDASTYQEYSEISESICSNELCKGQLSDFTGYLWTCDHNFEDDLRQLAILYNTTCKGNSQGSCVTNLLTTSYVSQLSAIFDTY